METRVQLSHPSGKKAVSIERGKYDVLKKALMSCLGKNKYCTHTDILQQVASQLKKDAIDFEGSVNWHLEWVKLDLEAKKIIQRNQDEKPVTYSLVK